MAESANILKITATSTGASDHIELPPGHHTLVIDGGGTYAGVLQVGTTGGVGMRDAYLGGSAAAFGSAGNNSFEVPGGCYRINVTTYGSGPITCSVASSRR